MKTMKYMPAFLLMFAPACSQAPAPAEQKKAQTTNPADRSTDAVQAKKKSIEQAADAAAKLIEDDSRQEIEALPPAGPQ
jgi:hypothetical protein